MKTIVLTTLLLLCTWMGYTQTQYPLYRSYDEIEGVYYKDLDNDLNKFQGTWRYTEGATSLTFVLKKKMQVNIPSSNYLTDILVGEYSFTKNGTQQVNTLANLEQNETNYANHMIYTTMIQRCDDCLPGQRNVIIGTLKDPIVSYYNSQVSLRYFVENGIEKLKISLKPITYVYTGELSAVPAGYEPVPVTSYILVKQP